jgi:hypothetical protein
MPKMYQISVRWVATDIDPPRIDAVLSQHGDWIRYSGMQWLVWTDTKAIALSNSIQHVLTPADSILVLAVDLRDHDIGGWAAPWVWNWIASKTQPSGLLVLLSHRNDR